MTIDEIMTREVGSCRPDDNLSRVAQIMWELDCGSVPVVREGRVIGMITDRDCCMAAYIKGLPLESIRVQDVMSEDVHTCGPRDDVREVEARMRQHRVRRIPVIEANGQCVGIVSLNDIAIAAARGRGRQGYPTAAEVGETLGEICQPRPQPTAA